MIRFFYFFMLSYLVFSVQTEKIGYVFVGGKLQPAKMIISQESEPLFSPRRYEKKEGEVLDVIGTRTLILRTSADRSEEFQMIGLMDISPIFNKELRNNITENLQKKLKGSKVLVYKPNDWKERGLFHNNVFVMKGERMINLEILREGMGIVPEEQNFYQPLKDAFTKEMNEAAEKKIGIWKNY